MMVFWSMGIFFGVCEWVYFYAHALDIYVSDVKDFMCKHKGLGVCAWSLVCDNSYYLLLDLNEFLDVCFVFVVRAP